MYAKALCIFLADDDYRTQELGQRGGDRLLRNPDRPLPDQPVRGSRAAVQSVSAARDPRLLISFLGDLPQGCRLLI